MRNGTYHRDLSPWVRDVRLPTLRYLLTRHVLEQARQRGFVLPEEVSGSVVEVTYVQGEPVKFLVRERYDRNKDLCMVLKWNQGSLLCLTAWLNNRFDTHATLKRERYAK